MTTRVSHLPTLREVSEIPSEVHAIPDLLKIFSALRLPLFKDFSSKPSSSSNKSPLISADSYATLASSAFIMSNTPQCGQIWTVVDFLTYNPKEPAPVITTVTTNQHVKMCDYEDLACTHLPPCQQFSQA